MRAAEAPATEKVGGNAFASCYKTTFPAGSISRSVRLGNEAASSRRIVIGESSLPGVERGDVLVAINGHSVPRNAAGPELEQLMSSREQYDGAPVPATLWRPHHPESFTEVAVFCGQRRIGVEWGRIKPQAEMPLPAIGGMFAAVDVRSQSGRAAIEFGDLLVGVNHKPVPADVSNDEIRLLLTKEQKHDPPVFNLVRCAGDDEVKAWVLRQCGAARKRLNRLRSSEGERKKRESSGRKTKTDDASSCLSCDCCLSPGGASKKAGAGGLRL